MPEIRYEVAMSAAGAILARADIPATPERLEGVAYLVLQAVYDAESRLAEQPRPLLCVGCLLSLKARPEDACRMVLCPRCGQAMRRPETVGRN